MKSVYIILSIILLPMILPAQDNDYWVFYKDKNNTEFNPESYFSPKALERRELQGIVIDKADYPVNSEYIKHVREIADEHVGSSRWFNASYVKATDEQVELIMKLDFVESVDKAVVYENPVFASVNEGEDVYIGGSDLVSSQINMFYPQSFYENNYDGTGVRIAVFDGGFPLVNEHEAFEHLWNDDKIKATYDFVKDKEEVWHANSHGTSVLSCIAGISEDGEKMGLAQDAEFILARTEKVFEPFREEIYWMEAVEWADKNGADLVNSSLGYTSNRYFVNDMDGKVSLVSKAANMAARKGILVVNAAGNDGDANWKVVGTPADADSILSVGGVDPIDRLHIDFSSYGPTSDGRLKPNVVASGQAHVASKSYYSTVYGTSFASPLTCGFAACVKEAFPELTVMELLEKIEESGSLYPYYDYAHGYGIPNAFKLLNDYQPENNIEIIETEDNKIKIKIKDEYYMRKGLHNSEYVFYHLSDDDGRLIEYKVVLVNSQFPVEFEKSEYYGTILRVHFNGYTSEKKIENN